MNNSRLVAITALMMILSSAAVLVCDSDDIDAASSELNGISYLSDVGFMLDLYLVDEDGSAIDTDMVGFELNTIIYNAEYNSGSQTVISVPVQSAGTVSYAIYSLMSDLDVSGNITLVQVTFDKGIGTGSMDSVVMSTGYAYTLPSCGFTAPAGQSFQGWKVGSGSDVKQPGDVVNISGNITIQAVFSSAPVLTGIEVVTGPVKTDYYVGDAFDPTGMVVKATYTDSSSVSVPLGSLEFTPSGSLSESDDKVTVSFTDGGVTRYAEVDITVTEPPAMVNVTWKNYNGTTLLSGPVEYGTVPTYTGSTPVKEQDVQYTYSFTGWSPEISAVTTDTTYTAQFTENLRSYQITWKNYDGTELQSGLVEYGTVPAYTGSEPVRGQDVQYTYTFAGWDPAVVAVSGEATYTAQFTENLRPYQITWKNYDGTVLDETTVNYGVVPEYTGATPVKEQSVQYTYTFAGWSPELTEVIGEATYTAQFTENLRPYQITWKNYDGTELQSGLVEYGTVPAYTGSEPVREMDVQYTYTFAGWNPEIVAVSGEATYTATYSPELRSYQITWKNYDGTVLDETTVNYGVVPEYPGETPVREMDVQYIYTFAGWDPAVVEVSGEATYTATYTPELRSYQITWKNYDGTELQSGLVEYGTVPAYTGEEPVKEQDVQYYYIFAGWNPEVIEVSGEATYTATYTSELRSYLIQWLNWDGSILYEAEFLYGEVPEYIGDVPEREPDMEYVYTFKCWEPEITEVVGEMQYEAMYKKTYKTSMITLDVSKGGNADVSILENGDAQITVKVKRGYALDGVYDNGAPVAVELTEDGCIYTIASEDLENVHEIEVEFTLAIVDGGDDPQTPIIIPPETVVVEKKTDTTAVAAVAAAAIVALLAVMVISIVRRK